MALKDFPMKDLGLGVQMVGAVYADRCRAWMVMLPDAPECEDPKPVNLTLDEWQEFLRQTDLVTVEAMVEDPDNKMVAKAIVRKSDRQISQQVSWKVYRRDGFKCRYCGVEDMPLTVDHLITWESGGPSTEANLVAACRKCNGARGETPFAEWLMDPYYRRVSAKIDHHVRFANQALIPTLASIPVSPLKGKRKR